MEYEVIKKFKDIQTGHIYEIGDKYPHKGRLTKTRIAELASTKNKIGEPLIRVIEQEEKTDDSGENEPLKE